MAITQLEELVIELAVQRERAPEGSKEYKEADHALDRLIEMHPDLPARSVRAPLATN